jgi:hypothetical protein
MKMEQDFKQDFIGKYTELEFEEVTKLIDEALSGDKIGFLKGDIWTLTQDIEKHNVLQFTHYISLSKDGVEYDEEVSLTFENGINAGTVCQDYSIDGGGGVAPTKMEEIFIDIEPDWDTIERKYKKKPNKHLIQQIFDYNKADIMDLLSKQSYDNYFTGGGTTKTDDHYKEKIQAWHDKGFYWVKVYENIEVDRNFIT